MQLRGNRRALAPLGLLGMGLALLAPAIAGDASPAAASAASATAPAGVHGPAGSGAGTQGGVTDPVLPGTSRSGSESVAVSHFGRSPSTPAIAPLGRLLPADLLVVAPATLSPSVVAAILRLHAVAGALPVDAARIEINGKLTATLGVDPGAFRAYAAKPTAQAAGLWENVAAGGVAISYTMGELDRVPLGRDLQVTGRGVEELPLAGLGTVGIGGVDAVVSDAVARSLGMPADNAIVISAPNAVLSSLMRRIQRVIPRGAAVAPLVAQAASAGSADSGWAGSGTVGGASLTRAQLVMFLTAAESRLGMPYVWGDNGPDAFDCSGLVQWSLAQAGVVMPRVAAEQALTGPLVPLSQLAPGDLLFYHTDPTAPDYISHVAIYLGEGEMLQAPEPGLDVEIVPASFGSQFAGAVQVDPDIAAAIAADPAA